MADLNRLNTVTPMQATLDLLKCCGSLRWAERVMNNRPFKSLAELNAVANDVWWSLDKDDWLEAFRSHPKIGQRKAEAPVNGQAQSWSEQEQSGVVASAESVKDELARLNQEYEKKFGYIFIVCATGKTSEEMLAILRTRLQNDATDELPIAAAEQAKITEIRLAKLLAL